jgi:hypothetical protein
VVVVEVLPVVLFLKRNHLPKSLLLRKHLLLNVSYQEAG